jgi:Tat protein translocase TatC
MGFLEHLDELRTRVIRSLLAIAAGMLAAFFFVEDIARFVLEPVSRALGPGRSMVQTGFTESLAVTLDLAFIGGLILAAPCVTWQMWRFVSPGLYSRERRLVAPVVALSALGAVSGAAFSHYILFPASVGFLANWRLPFVEILPRLADTFALYKTMMLAMLLVFQVPAIVLPLARLGLVTAGFLWRNLRYSVLIVFVAAAVLTATADPWNQALTAAPMLAMYVLSIGLAWLVQPRGTPAADSDTATGVGLVIGAAVFERARRERGRLRRGSRILGAGTGLAICLALTGVACTSAPPSAAFPDGEVVDLSHPYDAKAIFWPTAEPFRLEKVAAGVTEAGYYYASNNLFTSEHGGTHVDAPIHFAEGRQTVDRIPLDRLVGEAYVVDVREPAARDRDHQVSVADLTRAEMANGQIPAEAILLLRTGFAERWPDAERYLGTARRGEDAVAELHFPGLHPDAAKWLVENRAIAAVGIDTASIDYGQSKLFESHRTLFARDIPAFENLAALDRLPARGAFVVALPMKIAGGSGAPLRAVAILP